MHARVEWDFMPNKEKPKQCLLIWQVSSGITFVSDKEMPYNYPSFVHMGLPLQQIKKCLTIASFWHALRKISLQNASFLACIEKNIFTKCLTIASSLACIEKNIFTKCLLFGMH